LTSLECVKVIEAHETWVDCIISLGDGRVMSSCKNQMLKVSDVDAGVCLKEVTLAPNARVSFLQRLPSGQLVAGAGGALFFVMDAVTGECVNFLVGHDGESTAFASLGDGRIVTAVRSYAGETGHWGSSLRVWG
jgi:hypothetical protein